MTAIVIRDLSKRFGRKQALNKVSLTIEEGEMVALIGASGSGKSTLIRHIAGLERADQDSHSCIDLFGATIQTGGRIGNGARVMRREIGVIFQQFNLVARLPVITNVLLGNLGRIPRWRGTLGLFTREERLAARAALARVGIPEVAWQRASTLSGGQQQRAAIARCLVQKSRVLLADEPIASLDPASARRVMDALADINRTEKITAVVSLHQVEYARRYCPRTIALRGGEVVYDGPSGALTNAFLTELYGADSDELVLPDALPSDDQRVPAARKPSVRSPELAIA
ncbi:MAG: phosphonate ABC transporter ATP-binding protein [Aurantimonas endophytica]|uniref:Phosphonate transport system ATP-binding protein n=1 Tax=Aurantimonas endophytica TaxID=1522175 RepID=A0A7W6MQK3_9HYPH|nr:phosphonate ABC transporter ATP-binding protein [Aurantimonas endophytica]MBB4004085.1 phosphonate transport system ATP-binding protein [Aurantimonas endophytica]MCO6404931.1 phosphonate ABC transporter ATP-binding protein [Aurantimonas endophytica]